MKKFLKNVFSDVTHWIPDRAYLKIVFFLKYRKRLNLKKPKSFNEKIQWLKLNDRKSFYSSMVDKFEAKEYFKTIIDERYIIPTLGIYNEFSEIDFKSLPEQFVIKTTHDSGTVFICKKKANFNFKECEKEIKNSLNKNLFWRTREWPYKNVKPRIIVEEYISSEDLSQCPEYKIFCFNGVAKLVLVCQGEAHGSGRSNDFFDIAFNHIPVDSAYPQYKGKINKPSYYEEMVKIAESISKEIPFLRVDFYSLKNKFYIGETTFYHCGGFCNFKPKEYDLKFGELISLPVTSKK